MPDLTLPPDLSEEITRAGYYPQVVSTVLDVALGGEAVTGFLVHVETSFLDEEIRRHLTVLALTAHKLVIAHVDDHDGEEPDSDESSVFPPLAPAVAATTESVAVRDIRSVVVNYLLDKPNSDIATVSDMPINEINLAISWSGSARLEVEPAFCPNPECEGDHGAIGALIPEDVVVRISSAADGPNATAAAIDFARKLSAATSR